MQIRHVTVQWDPYGTVVSPRSARRNRPMAYELGRVLLALADAAASASTRDPQADALAVDVVASQAQLSEHVAGTVLHTLHTLGCLVRDRSHGAAAAGVARRWVSGYLLAPASALRGRGRRPPVAPRALLVEPSVACGDLLDVVLREAGVWAVQVVSIAEAEHLLAQMAFELVVVDTQAAAVPSDTGRLTRALRAAGCGPVLALTYPAIQDQVGLRALGARAELSKPFTPQAFAAGVGALGVGALIAPGAPADRAG